MKNLRRVTIGISVIGLFTALSFSQREDATTREITTAAVMGGVSMLQKEKYLRLP